MTAFKHLVQGQVAQTANGCVGKIGTQRSARVNIFEEIIYGTFHAHFVPDADSHRRALLCVHWIAPEVLLIQTRVDLVHSPEEPHEGGLRTKPEPEKMKTELSDDADHAAKYD